MNRRDEARESAVWALHERQFTEQREREFFGVGFNKGYEAATADNEKLREALQAIEHITDGHGGCDKHEPLCSSCEAHRLAKQALDTAERATDED